MYDVRDIRKLFIEKYNRHASENDMLELRCTPFVASHNYIFLKPNLDYVKKELAWYKTQNFNIFESMDNVPKIWNTIANEIGEVNSNYGALVFGKNANGLSQYEHVLRELENNLESRRAALLYMSRDMHERAVERGKNDFVCTYAVQFLYRNGALDCYVCMRSSDAVYGYRNDLPWHKYVHNRLVRDLRKIYETGRFLKIARGRIIVKGKIIWNAVSLHIYPRHFKYVR